MKGQQFQKYDQCTLLTTLTADAYITMEASV